MRALEGHTSVCGAGAATQSRVGAYGVSAARRRTKRPVGTGHWASGGSCQEEDTVYW